MTTVDTIKIANGQGARFGEQGMAVAAKDFHGLNYRFNSGEYRRSEVNQLQR
jgi:hypothetical protein